MKHLLIRGARVVDPSQSLDRIVDILVEDEKIKKIGEHIQIDEANIVEAKGLVAVP